MPAPLLKLIPTIVLVLTLAYLGWSHFDEEPPPAGPTGKLPDIANELLRPEALSATERDPFGKSIRFELGETSDERPDGSGTKDGRARSPDKNRTAPAATTRCRRQSAVRPCVQGRPRNRAVGCGYSSREEVKPPAEAATIASSNDRWPNWS